MNNKNNEKIVYIIVIFIVVLSSIWFFAFNKSLLEIKSIEYSHKSNYGTQIDNATKKVLINKNGNVKLSNDFDSYIEELTISKDKFAELESYINERKSIVYSGVRNNNNVLDGGASYIKIVLNNGKEYTIGGANNENEKYLDIVGKIKDTVGRDDLKRYENNIGKQDEQLNIATIVYSFGGGYGTLASTASRIITIYSDGHVLFSNSYNDYVEESDIEITGYNELKSFINARKDIFNRGVKENHNVSDGGSSHIKIILDNGEEYTVGGYMVDDNTFGEIVNKIYRTIDSNKFNEYQKNYSNN